MYTLTPKRVFSVPVDASQVTPQQFEEKTVPEIEALLLWEGNRKTRLDELFRIEDDAITDDTIRLRGDLSKIKSIGSRMGKGQLLIDGDVGMRLGEYMTGGTITVTGNADSWIGLNMKGGTIEIQGHARDYVGSAYRGSDEGIEGGHIIIHGNAGKEVGCYMQDGFIEINGNIDTFAGIHMKDGTIHVRGNSKGRIGGEMVGGKIVVEGHVPSVLPSFNIVGIRQRVRVGKDRIPGPFYLFTGDLADRGSGRLYLAQQANSHLQVFEKFLV
jgi:formylmethanofuran dehydrogenase subunit C